MKHGQTEKKSLRSFKLPRIGMRMLKSTVAVLICLLISVLVNREEMRIYSSIAALWCIRAYREDTKKMAVQRLTGTAVGAVYGALAILLEVYLFQIQGTVQGFLLVAVFILPVLWTTILLKVPNTSYFSCVVFLSITVAHMTDSAPWLFVWHRIAETLTGIAVGILINELHLPRRKQRNKLFVVHMDDALLDGREKMAPYNQVRLNRLLDDGALITLSTMRTPGALREAAGGLRFRLPVIIMDGAAMYDMGKKEFLHANILPKELVLACRALFDRHGIQCFLNGILDNVLMIYYGELKNEAEQDIYRRLHTSPYRNYVSQKYYNQCSVIYVMAIDETERLQKVYDEFQTSGLAERVKILFYPSTDYPGFSYIKIYEKSASRQAMLEKLKEDLGVEEAVTFGGEVGVFDITLHDKAGDRMVHLLERMYEPYLWMWEKEV